MTTPFLAKSQEGSPVLNAVGYVRVSTSDQAENGLSLPLQREAIARYCQQNSLKLLNLYSDPGRSGATIERPGLQQLLADAKLRQFQKVIVWRLDRWSRDLYQGLWLSKELLIHGVQEVASISEPLNGNDPLTKAMRAIVQTFAELERETIKSRLWSGRRKRLEQKKFAGGSVPYGYRLRDGALVIDPKAAEVVRLIFKLRNKKGLTYVQIAEELNRCYLKAPSGGLWRAGSVHYLINNSTYKGTLKYGEQQPEAHEAIIK